MIIYLFKYPNWFSNVQSSWLVGSWKIEGSMSLVHNFYTIQYLLHHYQCRTWYHKIHRCLIAGNSGTQILGYSKPLNQKLCIDTQIEAYLN